MSRWCDALWLHVNMGNCWKVRVSTLLIEMISLQVFKCEQALTQKQQEEEKKQWWWRTERSGWVTPVLDKIRLHNSLPCLTTRSASSPASAFLSVLDSICTPLPSCTWLFWVRFFLSFICWFPPCLHPLPLSISCEHTLIWLSLITNRLPSTEREHSRYSTYHRELK